MSKRMRNGHIRISQAELKWRIQSQRTDVTNDLLGRPLSQGDRVFYYNSMGEMATGVIVRFTKRGVSIQPETIANVHMEPDEELFIGNIKKMRKVVKISDEA